MKNVRMILIGCFLMIAACVKAQNISGKLVDGQNQPLVYANVVLQQMDSIFVKGETSDEKGSFRMEKVSAGDYRLVISSIGYETLYIDLQGFNRSTDLGTLTLKEDTKQLGEVTVTASNVTATADKKLVFPNEQQVKASANGVDLLRNLLIPRLTISPLTNSVSTTDGGTVQLAINGRKATQEEVTALQPAEIIRVEMLEDPGLRYGEADAVVNYVVRRYDMGGLFGYDGTQSTKSWFGNHNVNGKMNFGKSEICFYYGTNQQYFEELWYKRTETFTFEDGSQYHRYQQTEPVYSKGYDGNGGLTYNLQDGNKYMLNITAKLNHGADPTREEKGKLYTEEYPELVTDRIDMYHASDFTPSLDIYYQRNLKNKQFLAFNAVGTYMRTTRQSQYKEFLNNEPIVDYTSSVKGKKYSLIAEGIYEKSFANGGRLNTGIKHTQSYTNNLYDGTLFYHTQMRQAVSYGYVQYNGKWQKLRYGFGVGATRSWFHQDGQKEYEKWSFNPRFNLSYTFNNHWSTSLQGNANSRNPSLADISAADQLIDSLQIKRGNPDLDTYMQYALKYRLNFNKGKVNIGFSNNYYYYDRPLMQHIYRENGKFVQSYANHRRGQQMNTGINFRIGPFWNMLTLSGDLSFNQRWVHGINYTHTNRNIGGELTAIFAYKNFTSLLYYQHQGDSFWGETLSEGEKLHMVSVSYRIKNVNLGLRMFNPFKKDHSQMTQNFNQYAGYTDEYHIDDVARMVLITVSWNFSFGRDYKSKNKRMNNSDSDSGVM